MPGFSLAWAGEIAEGNTAVLGVAATAGATGLLDAGAFFRGLAGGGATTGAAGAATGGGASSAGAATEVLKLLGAKSK